MCPLNHQAPATMPPSRRPWVAHGLCATAILLTIILGCWQWQRSITKAAMVAQLAQYPSLSATQDPDVFNEHGAPHTKVRLSGQLDRQHMVWQASQLQHHQLGYTVWAPFLPDTPRAQPAIWVWVNLGWVPQTTHTSPVHFSKQDTSHAPEVLPPIGDHAARHASHTLLTGMVDTLPNRHLPGIPDANPGAHWPVVTVQPHWAQLTQGLHRRFYPLGWRVTTPDQGWTRVLPHPTMSPARHRGYAYQWWLMSMVCGIMWYRAFIKPSAHNTHTKETP